MYEVLLVVYLLVAITLVGLVLIQHGKGASMGASLALAHPILFLVIWFR